MEEEIFEIDEVGHIAKLIDTKMTLLQRMKIKKSTSFKIIAALVFYLAIMMFFSIVL